MKDSKFIELLNLYVDHQISAEDAALLEAEIQRSPERHRVYRQYCQMQKACTVLAENFQTQPVPAAGTLVEFPRRARSRLNSATYAMGALAVAACVALVVVERGRLNPSDGEFTSAPQVAISVPVEVAPVQTVQVADLSPARPALQPAFAGLVRDEASANTSLAARVPLDWMNRVQLQRMSTEELWFESRPPVQPNEFIFRQRSPADNQTKLAAFRFQR